MIDGQHKSSDAVKPVKKSSVLLEKVNSISISEENGDFIIASNNYISLYSLNGALQTILQIPPQQLPP
jgi:hypothetical protein